jgi:ABC-type phosphate transport system substrate-binding protein
VSILSDNTLSGLFSGQITNWDGLGNRTDPVHIYISPEYDDVRHAIESTILQGKPFTTQATIAANPLAMLKVISSDQSAIGYIPQSWIGNSSSTLTIDTHIPVLSKELMEELRQPIIVLSHNEPQGAARSLILCLQSSLIR